MSVSIPAATLPATAPTMAQDQNLYLRIFYSVDSAKKKTVIGRHFMILAMQTLYGWEAKRTEQTCNSLLAQGTIFSHKRGRIGRKPEIKTNYSSGVCCYCRKASNRLTRDHIIPRGRGGSDDPANIVSACFDCNQAKADRTPTEWARDVLKFRKPIKRHRVPITLRMRIAATLFLSFIGGLLR